jgi:hypothetical protein
MGGGDRLFSRFLIVVKPQYVLARQDPCITDPPIRHSTDNSTQTTSILFQLRFAHFWEIDVVLIDVINIFNPSTCQYAFARTCIA